MFSVKIGKRLFGSVKDVYTPAKFSFKLINAKPFNNLIGIRTSVNKPGLIAIMNVIVYFCSSARNLKILCNYKEFLTAASVTATAFMLHAIARIQLVATKRLINKSSLPNWRCL